MKRNDIIIAIETYALTQGVDFETACKMLNMMYEDNVHLEEDVVEDDYED